MYFHFFRTFSINIYLFLHNNRVYFVANEPLAPSYSVKPKSIDFTENAIRPFTVGRKNWLFSATPKGATASALVYTMVEMAKANELNIYKYLTYLLEHRPSEDMSDEQLEALTPWSKEVQNVCKN